METISIIVTLVGVIGGILQIILFFKVWGMCNDIRAMRNAQMPHHVTDNKANDKQEEEEKKTMIGCLALIVIFVILGIILYIYL